MSRIAKYPVDIPAKVEVVLAGGRVDVKGPLGALGHDFGGAVTIERKENQILFSAANGDQHSRAMSGTVSYTHLDVYKRQDHLPGKSWRF